jgi:hypothetical protein
MADPALWALMQRVETCRYRAERLESASEHWSEPGRELALDIARQWLQLAEELYALSAEDDAATAEGKQEILAA